MARHKANYIIGIDEVGRGALAGPVAVAVVLAITNLKLQTPNPKLKLKDSKRLTAKQREIWFKYIKNELALPHAVIMVQSKIIDKVNISQAANLAATRAFKKLIKNLKPKNRNYQVLLDGGLYIKKPKTKNYKLKTIIKGDEKIPAIMLASIMAKVSRDKRMRRLHKRYPQYDFINNVGYGTKKHIKAIKKFGPSPIHRKSFKIR